MKLLYKVSLCLHIVISASLPDWKTGRQVIFCTKSVALMGFPDGSDGKASAYNAGDLGSIPGLGRSLEKEMATHSSTIAWKIPWMEKPGGLQSTESQRVRTQLSD